MVDVNQIRFSRSGLGFIETYAEFYSTCFPGAQHLKPVYLNWLYGGNPSGLFVGADAWYCDSLVGQVVAIPGRYRLNDSSTNGLLAVNVAVHPKFQGRHLFKKLGLLMCEYAANAGYEFVIGVSNRAATIGWTRQMGFQLVRQLDARIGICSPSRAAKVFSDNCQFSRIWDEENLRWRVSNPNNKVYIRESDGMLECFARAKGVILPVYAQLPVCGEYSSSFRSPMLSPVRLFLGVMPDEDPSPFLFSKLIPERFKPSPLNLIYKSLSGKVPKLDASAIRFSFLDFDAY